MENENLHVECFPITILPHLSRLFTDYAQSHTPLPFYRQSPYSREWMVQAPQMAPEARSAIADLLRRQNLAFGAGEKTLANIERLRNGAGAVVTGQQVTLLGGPLYTLLKAVTAVRKAQDATDAGFSHVPIFWLATEDHDLAEADHIAFPLRRELRTYRLELENGGNPVGGLKLGPGIQSLLDQVAEILGGSEFFRILERCYKPDATFAQAFGSLLAQIFSAQGLIVIDASDQQFHALGAPVFQQAITDAEPIRNALLARDKELIEAGYHTQVLVAPHSSLLFLLDEETKKRQPLRRKNGEWSAGKKTYTSADLLEILKAEPERLSPNALLRPVFQDFILPTSLYIAGPAEIAYFAQSQVIYERVLGRTTAVLPRLSVTFVEPQIAEIMAKYEIALSDLFVLRPEDLAQRIGARSMPLEGKKKLAAAGNALDAELKSLTDWMHSLDPGLGRSAAVAASKMRYQMNRLRRMAANFQLQKESGLRREVEAVYLALFPERHLQERAIGAGYFLSRYGNSLMETLLQQAAQECPGHKVIYL